MGDGKPAQKATEHPGARKDVTFSYLCSEFKEPEMIYAPFSWLVTAENITKKDSDFLNSLVEASIKQRSNPGYLFPILKQSEGKDVFLSEEYLDVFGEALKIAEKSGTAMSFCDEWTWPSGQACGNLLEQHPELRAETLHYEIREVSGNQTIHLDESFFTVAANCKGPLGVKSTKIISSTLRIISRGDAMDWDVPAGCWRIYRFIKRPQSLTLKEGVSNVNYLDRRLPKYFINLAHRPYEERFGNHFGKTIPGFFADHEGQYGWKLAWSDDFENEYRQKKGRDIRLWMPLMIHRDIEGLWAQARWDWHDVVSDLYADNFFGGVSRWAAERGMYYTIHFWEEGLGMQAACAGSLFKSLRAVSMPGVDSLADAGLWVRQFKEAQSVAEFEGRRLMSESWGCHGWNFSPVHMKKTGNCMIKWSVSHVLQACMYVNEDLRKAAYGTELYRVPYSRHLHHWNDFARRASYINSHGHTVPDALVIYPIDSVWAAAGGDRFDANIDSFGPGKEGELLQNWSFPKPVTGPGIKQMDGGEYVDHVEQVYTALIEDLDRLNVEFLIADSEYIQVMDVTSEGTLNKGQFSFKAVVVPPLLIMPMAIAEKLLTFAQKGGEVYIMGGAPVGSTEEGIGSIPTDPQTEKGISTRMRDILAELRSPTDPGVAGISTRMTELMAKLLSLPSVHQVEESIYPYCKSGSGLAPKAEFLNGDFPILLQHRRIDGREFYWLANNTGREQVSRIKFRDVKGSASIWDCETGKITSVPSNEADGGSVLSLTFSAYEGYWLVFDPEKTALAKTPVATKSDKKPRVTEVSQKWKVYIDPEDQTPAIYPGFVPNIPEDFLLENGGIEDSLKLWSEWGLTEFNGLVTYENTFSLPKDFNTATMCLGRLTHSAQVWLNGKLVGSALWPPYKFDISEFVRNGENKIKIVVGNLLCNPKPAPGGSFIWWKEKAEDFEAGLIGPVRILTF